MSKLRDVLARLDEIKAREQAESKLRFRDAARADVPDMLEALERARLLLQDAEYALSIRAFRRSALGEGCVVAIREALGKDVPFAEPGKPS